MSTSKQKTEFRRQKLARLRRDRKQNTDLADRFRIDLIKPSFIQIRIPQITRIPKYLRYQEPYIQC
jgi:hypothetical protein